MTTDQFIRKPGAWLRADSDEDCGGVVISSRVRLARNIDGVAFPDWAEEEAVVRLAGELGAVLRSLPDLSAAHFFEMQGLSELDKQVLKERHLVSNELTEKGAGSAVIVSQDEQVSVMINEEDHLRLQALCPGLGLGQVWTRIDAIDTAVAEKFDFAFSAGLGYLTACPTNVGTGLRASVMLHLPGLGLCQEVEPVIKGLERIGFAVRGLLGEGTEASGNMYQVPNQSTLGEAEEDIMARLVDIIREVVRHERNARERLNEGGRIPLLDHVGRAYGVLLHARSLPSREALDLLSALRLGVEFGLITGVTVGQINETMILTQPGHLQIMQAEQLDAERRDEVRAAMVRQRLTEVNLTDG